MKHTGWLVWGLVLFGCIIPPSEAVIQTAIAQTQVAASGETPEAVDFYKVIEEIATLPDGFALDVAEEEMPDRYLWNVDVEGYAGYKLHHARNSVGWIEVFTFESNHHALVAYSRFWDHRDIPERVMPPPQIGEMTSVYIQEITVDHQAARAFQAVVKHCNCVVDYVIWDKADRQEFVDSAMSLVNAIPCNDK